MRKWLLIGIIAAAFLLRVVGLSNYPVGFTVDEASFGYDAYSLLETGKDQWGNSWPISLHSFGDFKLPIYTYLALPTVAIFGLNEFAVRLPGAIFGTLAVLFTYLVVVELFRNKLKRFKKDDIALLAALLLTISPWHILLSRGAFEANLTSFFIPLGLWAFYRGIAKPKWMLLAALSFGINLFTYHSARLFTPLLVFGIVLIEKKRLLAKSSLKGVVGKHKGSIALFLFFLILTTYTMFFGASSRGLDVAIFNPTDNWRAVSERRYEAVLLDLPDPVSRAFSNKATYTARLFIHNLLTYTSPAFLFLQGAGEATYGMIPGIGVLYLVEIVFIMAALISFVRKPNRMIGFFLLWILVGFLPASLSKGSGYSANRAAVIMPAIQVVSAYGILVLIEYFKKKRLAFFSKKICQGAIAALLFISLVSFLENYIYHSPANVAPAMSYGWKETFNFVGGVENNYNNIVISRAFSEPQILVAFYSQIDPSITQKESEDWLRYQEKGLPFLDQLGEYYLGKYTFRDINFSVDQKLSNVLIIGKPREFPEDILPLKTIYYPNNKPAILIVDPSIQSYAEADL
ncbi:glycosyltransferase family 39 protein [Candidatus Woesebacteria bacterium]|nr:glycosyltransferase family 39 protein [Candidatus Woesebacteria bacterium]